jgi:hypothetical protein
MVDSKQQRSYMKNAQSIMGQWHER